MIGKLIPAVATAMCALAAAAPAYAEGKERVVVERFGGAYEFAIPCGDFGPYGFDNVVTGTDRGQVTEVIAADGTLLQLVIAIQFSETNTNSVTGAAVTLKGAVHEVWDFESNTRTLSGKVFLGTAAGGGTWVQDTGRITIGLDDRAVSFLAGPHEAFFAGGIDPVVCAELAA